MPSKMMTTATNYLSKTGTIRAKLQAVGQEAAKGRTTLSVRGPFAGLTPDIDPNLLEGTAFRSLSNCLARSHGDNHGEVLALPDGTRQIDSARLPLGVASLPAAVATADPVVRVDLFTRFAPTGSGTPGEFTGEYIATPMAVSSGSGTADTSFMYRIAASGHWTQVAPAASMTAGNRRLSAGRDGRASSPSMPDSCVAPFGAVARAANSGGNDDKQTGTIEEPCWIYTNDVDEVMVFPAVTAGGLHTYEPLCDHISSADLDSGGANGFKCKSVETWNGRVYFLNTSEANTRRPQRLRRTAKFTADPATSIVGSGFYDFHDFQGEGLRIESLGDVLAVYFTDGVAFMRPTGNPTSPDEPQIIATERGLLSTHSVTAIGRNVHFGVFTDGWWLLDQSGRWQEVGIAQINNKSVPKWRDSFYDLIDPATRNRIYCYYDQPANLVYIAVPTEESPSPSQVWVYDPISDRVFIENYSVTCFGTYQLLTQTGTIIDSVGTPIDTTPGTIDSYGPIIGPPKIRVHGDEKGFVYRHGRDIEGYHGPEIVGAGTPTVQDPTWSFSLGLRSPTGIRNLATIDRVSLEYFNHMNNTNVSIEVAGPSADGSQNRSVVLNSGDSENSRYRDAWFRYSSTAPGITVSGTGTYHIRSLEVDAFLDPIEPRGT
jgi:hypothetical protein